MLWQPGLLVTEKHQRQNPLSPHLLPDVASRNFCCILVRKETHQAGMVRAEFMEGVFEAARLWTVGNWKNQKWTIEVNFKSQLSELFAHIFLWEMHFIFFFCFPFLFLWMKISLSFTFIKPWENRLCPHGLTCFPPPPPPRWSRSTSCNRELFSLKMRQ